MKCPAEENANCGRLLPINARRSSEKTDTRINKILAAAAFTLSAVDLKTCESYFNMQERKPLLSRIRSPQDLKDFSVAELSDLASEIRSLIVTTVSRNGGHLASNLGVVELTIALHSVFDSPLDKIVWDVGHQCYTHKLLTGRYGSFPSIRKSGGISGFPKIAESPHDSFNTGHASTSISAALGILVAEKIRGTGNHVAAVIGDGALTGGLAYEALSHAGQLGLPLVVVLNDNKMSISPNVGGLSKYLSRLSVKVKYQKFRSAVDSAMKKIPFIGLSLFNIIVRLKRAIKAVFYTDNFFVDLGFEYAGPIEGHQIQQLIHVIRDAKNLNRPVVIHVITRKGKGFRFAEEDPGTYHGVQPFRFTEGLEKRELWDAEISAPDDEKTERRDKTFTQVFGDAVLEAGRRDKRVVVITAAMEEGTGLSHFREAFPGRFFDVGIAEEHAVTFSAGIAAASFRPVTAIYSTFIQRAADELIHDVCLQNLPVVFALDRAGLVSDDGETHQGIFDISLFRSAPNLTILAPAGEEELVNMLDWAVKAECPVLVRYPKAICPAGDPAFSVPLQNGKGVWIKAPRFFSGEIAAKDERAYLQAGTVCIIFTGSLYPQVLAASAILSSREVDFGLYNLRFIKPIDEDYLASILNRFEVTVLAEEGRREGGIGEYVSSLALRMNCRTRLTVLGVEEKFDALGKREELLARNGLDSESIAKAALKLLFESESFLPASGGQVEH